MNNRRRHGQTGGRRPCALARNWLGLSAVVCWATVQLLVRPVSAHAEQRAVSLAGSPVLAALKPTLKASIGNELPLPGCVRANPNINDPSGALCVWTEKRGAQVLVFAYTAMPGPLTFSVQGFVGENLRLPQTLGPLVLPGRTNTLIHTAVIVNPAKAWRISWGGSPFQIGGPVTQPDSIIYQLPFDPHQKYVVIQGSNGAFSHAGTFAVDFGMPIATPVLVARSGVVLAYNDQATETTTDKAAISDRRRSNWISVLHTDGTTGNYVHLAPKGVTVRVGQNVQVGQQIGLSGNTGYSTAPHLHFEVRRTVNDRTVASVPVRFARWVGDQSGADLTENVFYPTNPPS